jgi:hypothetical protein
VTRRFLRVPAAALAAILCLAGSDPAPGLADIDPDNDEEVAPPAVLPDCEARLSAAGVEFASAELPLKMTRAGFQCGSEQAVRYRRGPGRIRYGSSPVLTCGMALALARFELVLQEEAVSHFGRRVARIEQGGTYSCRTMARYRDFVSEHSYGNAIDLYAFVLDDGRRISVLSHFGKLDVEPKRVEARFLRAVARRAFDENVFSVVLTPFFDNLHKNHFHVDLARYRVDGTR